ncbi:MAG: sensor domain-containing diguanylate cyclase [Fervidobacterium sp.]|uniref:sensor domain-containing diguanylate cyclase n=1 Tax=Fervidobacterium TaxID=2422 RepID=UPI0021FF4027|nr:diguanylate cyclase [Fervidobacterium riparium]
MSESVLTILFLSGALIFFAILIVRYVIKYNSLRNENKALNTLLQSMGIIVSAENLGLAVWADDELIYINSPIIQDAAKVGIELRNREEIDDLLQHPEKNMILYDFLKEVKKQIDSGTKDYVGVWKKEIQRSFIEIKYVRKYVDGKQFRVVITRNVTYEFTSIESSILQSLTEILDEEISKDVVDIKRIGEKIRELLIKYGLADVFGIGLLNPGGEIYYPYFKYKDDDDRSGLVMKPSEKTLSRYIIDKGIRVHIRNSVTEERLADGYYLKELRGNVYSIYGVPIIFRGLSRGVILFEKEGENQFSDLTLSVFDKMASVVSLSLRFMDIIEELEVEKRKLFEVSIKDYLTGAYSRLFLDQFLEKELSKSKRTQHPTSVIFLDVNDFKRINDVYGHIYGDNVLKMLVETINKTIRSMDIVARYGGDEFVIVLPETDAQNAESVMKRITENLKEHNIFVSYGIINISGYNRIEDIYKDVDEKMYEMKKSKNKDVQ